jgi:CRISPR system Cascade subunit CasD
MPSPESYLSFLLDGPLQGWGNASQFDRRMTAAHPSKSGVIGLCAAALGVDKRSPDEAERLARLAALRLVTYRLPRVTRDGRELPVTRLSDFHTVGGGYDRNDPAEALSIPRKASGGPLDNPAITTREYLQDARFGVLLIGDAAVLAPLPAAFADPRWGLWLGRRCCIPSTPILPEIHADRASAFGALLRMAGVHSGRREDEFERTEDAAPDDYRADSAFDAPTSFGQRRFVLRRIRTVAAQSPA